LVDKNPFRKKEIVESLARKVYQVFPGGNLRIMEVCGTHTMAIARYGLRSLLPENLMLISGPGCPVCITPASIIKIALKLARRPGTVIMTFGDMMRVPVDNISLEKVKAEGADVRVVYSAMDILDIAENEKEKEFVFISVGFETTTPGTALSIIETVKRGLENVHYLVANRFVIPALHALCSSKEIKIDGFLCPGHVSVIIGSDSYSEITEKYKIPCVVAGFEPVDIMFAIYRIVTQLAEGKVEVENAYSRVVKGRGNEKAQDIINRVFKPVDAEWRGLGMIPKSGLALRKEFSHLDALKSFDMKVEPWNDPPGCRCGDVLKGLISPSQCALFAKRCNPESPVGPCMVSSEGSCAAYYRYGVDL